MPLSNSYAAPQNLDLRPGRWEYAAWSSAILVAAIGILSADLSGAQSAVLLLIVAALAARGARNMAARPRRVLLYADGQVEAAVSADLRAAALLQACTYLGFPQLELRDADGRRHSCVLFPDRLDAAGRHRLRVWLATHQPEPASAGASSRHDPDVGASSRREPDVGAASRRDRAVVRAALATQGRSYTGVGS